ncbi:MAG: diguanylate cyclase domain-containing protein [Burkholderiaceae bacterium]
MTLNRKKNAARVDTPVPLAAALDQNQEVEEKVEKAAEDLGVVKSTMKKEIAKGTTAISAQQLLADTQRVESKVQEAATDLREVNETLAQGIEDLRQTEVALSKANDALAATEAALMETRADEKKARLQAVHDAKTGLPNRDLFDDRLAQAISLAKRQNWTLAVMFLDLDCFKAINDTHGHAVGDQVLKEVANRLIEHNRGEDTVCRNGGDEFLYLLVNPKGSANIERIAAAVSKSIAQPIVFDNQQLAVKSSIGIAIYPDNGNSGEQLIENADAAMYRAKQLAGGWVFSDALGTGQCIS